MTPEELRMEAVSIAGGDLEKAAEIVAFVTGTCTKTVDASEVKKVVPEKTKRKRRTKAEMEANKKAAEEAKAAKDAEEGDESPNIEDAEEENDFLSGEPTEDNVRALGTEILRRDKDNKDGIKKSDLVEIFVENGAESIDKLNKKGLRKTFKALKKLYKKQDV